MFQNQPCYLGMNTYSRPGDEDFQNQAVQACILNLNESLIQASPSSRGQSQCDCQTSVVCFQCYTSRFLEPRNPSVNVEREDEILSEWVLYHVFWPRQGQCPEPKPNSEGLSSGIGLEGWQSIHVVSVQMPMVCTRARICTQQPKVCQHSHLQLAHPGCNT